MEGAHQFITYRRKRAKQTIDEIPTLIEQGYWNTALNRLYYSCFYAVTALLVQHGISSTSHSGTRQKFSELFIKTGRLDIEYGRHYARLFEKRQRGDYGDFYDADEQTIKDLYSPSLDFIKQIEMLLDKHRPDQSK